MGRGSDASPGGRGVTSPFHQDQDDPNAFLIWEQWATRPNYEAYLAWREETGVLKGFVDLLAGPPTFTFYDFVGA